MRSAILAVIAFLVAVPVGAQSPPPGGSPVFHGVLEVLPAPGTIDRATGAAVLRLHRWRLQLQPAQDGLPGSNGIFPDRERVLIALGSGGENDLYLPPGSLVAHRRGKVFTYRAPRGTVRGVKAIRITEVQKDPTTGLGGVYRVNATLVGVVLTDLLFRTRPDCMPLAIIVGDDDGFSGVQLSERNLDGRRIAVAGSCGVGTEWPWLGP
jgi:hypothetical protein